MGNGRETSMKALISGSNGFVGKRLVELLKVMECESVGIPRETYYNSPKLAELFQKEQPDLIFHCAAYGNMAGQDDIPHTIQANILGLVSMISASLDVPYSAFINISTSSVLLDYETFYSASKGAGERLARAFENQYNAPIVTVRPYSLYGPGEAEFRFIPTVFRSCLMGEEMKLAPNAVHDWTYVDDFCEALIDIATHAHEYKGKIVGIGTGIQTSNEQIVGLIQNITGKPAHIGKEQDLRLFDTYDWKARPDDYLCSTKIIKGLKSVYAKSKT